jgi:hypothetical protein
MLGAGSERHALLAKTVARSSHWLALHPEVESFDVNPVLIGLDGKLVAVDARVETIRGSRF